MTVKSTKYCSVDRRYCKRRHWRGWGEGYHEIYQWLWGWNFNKLYLSRGISYILVFNRISCNSPPPLPNRRRHHHHPNCETINSDRLIKGTHFAAELTFWRKTASVALSCSSFLELAWLIPSCFKLIYIWFFSLQIKHIVEWERTKEFRFTKLNTTG